MFNNEKIIEIADVFNSNATNGQAFFGITNKGNFNNAVEGIITMENIRGGGIFNEGTFNNIAPISIETSEYLSIL